MKSQDSSLSLSFDTSVNTFFVLNLPGTRVQSLQYIFLPLLQAPVPQPL